MSHSYDSRQMATDALVLATPPLHTGVKSFVSEEGVQMLANELEDALYLLEEYEKEDE